MKKEIVKEQVAATPSTAVTRKACKDLEANYIKLLEKVNVTSEKYAELCKEYAELKPIVDRLMQDKLRLDELIEEREVEMQGDSEYKEFMYFKANRLICKKEIQALKDEIADLAEKRDNIRMEYDEYFEQHCMEGEIWLE